ncbi:hypothetical protein BOMU111920_15415 [Bordetella muralis]|jgi:hypothetical protein
MGRLLGYADGLTALFAYKGLPIPRLVAFVRFVCKTRSFT